MKEIYLTKSEKSLLNLWRTDADEFVNKARNIANEVVAMKLETMAREKGIDLEKEKWSFDIQVMKFYQPEESKKEAIDVTPVVPGRKRGRPKRGIIPVVNEEGHLNEEEK